jgi:hypothetical protein
MHAELIIQANEYNCAITINKSNIAEFENIHRIFNVVYFVINGTVIKNNKYIDIIMDTVVFRQICTFHQTDDVIKNNIYDIIFENCNNYDQLICVGGEMYIFAQLLKCNKLLCYSDYKSIVDDTEFNIGTYDNVHLVDYSIFTFSTNSSNTCLIANTSKSGMGINLCNNIIRNNIKKLVIISCNEKSFSNDYSIIMKYYSITIKKIINYVSINILEYNSI